MGPRSANSSPPFWAARPGRPTPGTPVNRHTIRKTIRDGSCDALLSGLSTKRLNFLRGGGFGCPEWFATKYENGPPHPTPPHPNPPHPTPPHPTPPHPTPSQRASVSFQFLLNQPTARPQGTKAALRARSSKDPHAVSTVIWEGILGFICKGHTNSRNSPKNGRGALSHGAFRPPPT